MQHVTFFLTMSNESTAIIIRAFICNKLDYCSSLPCGLSDFQIQCPQKKAEHCCSYSC